MVRPLAAVAAALLLAGCGGGSKSGDASPVPCDDAAFRAQDEELYVTSTVISNALGGAGDPATALLDLRRARAALAGYLEAHPPCAAALETVREGEGEAVSALDDAIAALDDGSDGRAPLETAAKAIQGARSALAATP